MTITKTILGLTLIALGTTALTLSAHADDDRWEQQRTEYHHDNRYYDDDRYSGRFNPHDIGFADRDRVIIQSYEDEDHDRGYHGKGWEHRKHKKHGHVTYIIGQPLPPNVIYVPLPTELRMQLHPAPRGYQYVQVDQDVLLISQATKKVIDAVTLLSAVGH